MMFFLTDLFDVGAYVCGVKLLQQCCYPSQFSWFDIARQGTSGAYEVVPECLEIDYISG